MQWTDSFPAFPSSTSGYPQYPYSHHFSHQRDSYPSDCELPVDAYYEDQPIAGPSSASPVTTTSSMEEVIDGSMARAESSYSSLPHALGKLGYHREQDTLTRPHLVQQEAEMDRLKGRRRFWYER